LKFSENAEKNYEEIVEYITLASKTGTPFVRVLGDLEPEPQEKLMTMLLLRH